MTFINGIRVIKNVGKFENYVSKKNLKFEQLTLIYSENARGKTTLASIISALGTKNSNQIKGRKRINSKVSPEILIELSNKKVYYKNYSWSSSTPDILVFDEQFVSNYLYIGNVVEGRQRKNLYDIVLGKRGVRLKSSLNLLNTEFVKTKSELKTIQSKIKNQIENFGMDVEKFCNLPVIPNISEEFAIIDKIIRDADSRKDVLMEDCFSNIALLPIDIDVLNQILIQPQSDVGSTSIDEMEKKIKKYGANWESWVKQGFSIVKEYSNSLYSECPYCAQSLDESDLSSEYLVHFDSNYIEIQRTTNILMNYLSYSHSRESVSQFKNEFNTTLKLQSFWSKFTNVNSVPINLATILDNWNEAIEGSINILSKKIVNPKVSINIPKNLLSSIEIHNSNCIILNNYNKHLQNINEKIVDLKLNAKNFIEKAMGSEFSILMATKFRYSKNMDTLCKQYISLKRKLNKISTKRNKLNIEVESHRVYVLKLYGKAINRNLSKLNAGFMLDLVQPNINTQKKKRNFQIEYKLIIDGSSIPLVSNRDEPQFKNTLSLGDRHSLALALFFSYMENNSNKSNSVVVFDDPITSLDEHRVFHTSQEISRLVCEMSETIVLSHSKPFLLSLWNQSKLDRKICLEIVRKGNGSDINVWNVENDLLTENEFRHNQIQKYLEGTQCINLHEIASSLRPILEHYFKNSYYSLFSPRDSLGSFINKCKNSLESQNPILSQKHIEELESIRIYINQFHHDGKNSNKINQINEAELTDFIKRTLKFIRLPVDN